MLALGAFSLPGFGTCSEGIGTKVGRAPFLKDQQREKNVCRVPLSSANMKQESKEKGLFFFFFPPLLAFKTMKGMSEVSACKAHFQ